MTNLSESGESRSYNLTVNGNTSDGLVITASGSNNLVSDPLSRTISFRGNDSVQIKVQKFNPLDQVLSYPSVEFDLTDECDGTEAGSTTLSFNYTSACGGIDLVSPADSWINRTADNNIMPVTFSGYTLANIDSVTMEYTKARIIPDWKKGFTLKKAAITDPTSFTYQWNVSSLPDTTYRLRLRLRCINGNIIYADIVKGVIDRAPPALVGKPQPANEFYTPGNSEISFTYGENIDVSDLNNNKAEMVRLSDNSVVPITVTGIDDKLVINPETSLSGNGADSFRVIVKNSADLYNNVKTEPDTSYFTLSEAAIGGYTGSNVAKVYVVPPTKFENSAGKMEVHVKLSANQSKLTKVYFNVSGSALYNSDYTVTYDTVLQKICKDVNCSNFIFKPVYSQFIGSPGFVYIAANKTDAVFYIDPVEDQVVEGDENIKISLATGGDYKLEDSTIAVATIADQVRIVSDGPLVSCNGSSVGLSASPAGNALSFDGVDDYVAVNNALGNFGASDFTIEMNVKTSSTNAVLASKRGICGYDNFFSLGISGGKVNFDLADNTNGDNYTNITPSSLINDNTWHHVAVMSYQGAIRIYIDGILEAFDYSSAYIDNTSVFKLGTSVCVPAYADPFVGQMDEVRIWNVFRTDAQRLAGMNSAVPANSPGLLAYFKFNEATGISVVDASSHGNNGITVNGPARVASTAPFKYASYSWHYGGYRYIYGTGYRYLWKFLHQRPGTSFC